MKTPHLFTRHSGTALAVALITAGVIATASAVTFAIVNSKNRVIHQGAAWKESLLTAEAGIEMAMNEVRKNLYDPTNAWQGWKASADPTLYPLSTAPGASAEMMTYSFTSQALVRGGEGGQRSWAQIVVDAPRCLLDRTGEQWFRIRSLGLAEVPGSGVVGGAGEDVKLRKFDLAFDRRKGTRVASPRAARLIEAIAKPVGAFRLAVFGMDAVDLTDRNILIDSYDSRDNAKSTNGGYDPAKRQNNGDVATNGQLINAGNAEIYGDVLTNEGTALNTDNVHGEIRDDFYQEVFNVVAPAVTPEPFSPGVATTTTVLDAKAGTPANYVLSSVRLSGQDTLRIRGAEDGSTRYAQVIVRGNLELSGLAQIILDRGVFVRFFVVGDADITGKGFLNPNSPLALQLYGVDRPKKADGSPADPGLIKIAGNGGFCGAVYAPNYNVELKGGGSADTLFGAFIGYTVRMTGVQSVHYDEALADGGLISDFKIVSWFEDEE